MSTSVIMWAVVLWLGATVPALAAEDRATIVKERSSFTYATPGSKCQTEDGTAAAMTLSTRQRMTEVGSRDMKAYQRFFDQGLAINMRPLTVFVEAREAGYAQIRPEGRLESLWVSVFSLECPQEPKAPQEPTGRQKKKGAR